MITWFIVVFMLLCSILLIGLNQKDLVYIKLEYKIKYETYKYLNDNNIKVKLNGNYSLDINKLIEDKYITDKNIDKYCIKKVNMKNKILLDKYTIIKKCDK